MRKVCSIISLRCVVVRGKQGLQMTVCPDWWKTHSFRIISEYEQTKNPREVKKKKQAYIPTYTRISRIKYITGLGLHTDKRVLIYPSRECTWELLEIKRTRSSEQNS
jgi:hypothetical protein